MNRNDAGMVNRSSRPGLVEEAGHDVAVGRHLGLQHLHNGLGTRLGVDRQEDVTESALVLSQGSCDAIPVDLRSHHQRLASPGTEASSIRGVLTLAYRDG